MLLELVFTTATTSTQRRMSSAARSALNRSAQINIRQKSFCWKYSGDCDTGGVVGFRRLVVVVIFSFRCFRGLVVVVFCCVLMCFVLFHFVVMVLGFRGLVIVVVVLFFHFIVMVVGFRRLVLVFCFVFVRFVVMVGFRRLVVVVVVVAVVYFILFHCSASADLLLLLFHFVVIHIIISRSSRASLRTAGSSDDTVNIVQNIFLDTCRTTPM